MKKLDFKLAVMGSCNFSSPASSYDYVLNNGNYGRTKSLILILSLGEFVKNTKKSKFDDCHIPAKFGFKRLGEIFSSNLYF